MPHEHPRLGAVATVSMNGADFATMLDRAIERSGKGREIKQIEAAPTQQIQENGENQEDDLDKGGGVLADSAIASRNCAFP